jgi:DNA-binding transcriptional regulator YiaG
MQPPTATINLTPAEIRAHTGLTQARIAAQLHISLRTWQKWEAGVTSLSPRNIESLLLVLHIHPALEIVARRKKP